MTRLDEPASRSAFLLKELGMQANEAPVQSGGLSSVKSHALLAAALAAALLGLTLLDVESSHANRQAKAVHSIDCIVASAVFAGVSVALP
jgi:hypothetical protein